MLRDAVPSASTADVLHFRTMMDANGDKLISQQEFLKALQSSRDTATQVDRGRQTSFARLSAYWGMLVNDRLLAILGGTAAAISPDFRGKC